MPRSDWRAEYARGTQVALTRETVPWYSGYGANPRIVLPAGAVGVVTSNDAVTVRGNGARGLVARFETESGPWQCELRRGDFRPEGTS